MKVTDVQFGIVRKQGFYHPTMYVLNNALDPTKGITFVNSSELIKTISKSKILYRLIDKMCKELKINKQDIKVFK